MNSIKVTSGIVLVLFSLTVHAEKREIWHGWADMPGFPCSKTFHYKDSFGISWPSLKFAPQEHHTYIYANLPSEGEILNKAKDCALVGVGSAGAAALALTPPVAWPVFKGAFMTCAAAQGLLVAESSLDITGTTKCRW